MNQQEENQIRKELSDLRESYRKLELELDGVQQRSLSRWKKIQELRSEHG